MGMSDEMKQLPLARWRSRRVERRCRALEDSLWTSAPESVSVPTRFGSTQAYRWPGSGVPLVLLHGGAVTSITWEPIAEAMPIATFMPSTSWVTSVGASTRLRSAR